MALGFWGLGVTTPEFGFRISGLGLEPPGSSFDGSWFGGAASRLGSFQPQWRILEGHIMVLSTVCVD